MNDLWKLPVSIVIDLIGGVPSLLGLLGISVTGGLSFLASEAFDLIWAPLSAIMVYFIYEGDGVVTSIQFIEELLPLGVTDLLPTATIAFFMSGKN